MGLVIADFTHEIGPFFSFAFPTGIDEAALAREGKRAMVPALRIETAISENAQAMQIPLLLPAVAEPESNYLGRVLSVQPDPPKEGWTGELEMFHDDHTGFPYTPTGYSGWMEVGDENAPRIAFMRFLCRCTEKDSCCMLHNRHARLMHKNCLLR